MTEPWLDQALMESANNCGVETSFVYQKSVCKVYRICLQSSATGFLMPDHRHFLSLYSYSLFLLQAIFVIHVFSSVSWKQLTGVFCPTIYSLLKNFIIL